MKTPNNLRNQPLQKVAPGPGEFQLERLKEVVALARAHVRYYRDLGVAPVVTIDDFRQIPVLSSERLAQFAPPQSDALLNPSVTGGMILRSGGTSGVDKVVIHPWVAYRRVMEAGARGLGEEFSSKRIANCIAAGNFWGGFMFGNGLAEILNATILPIGSDVALAETRRLMHLQNADTLLSTPSFSLRILEAGDPLPTLSNLLFVGENLGTSLRQELLKAHPGLKIRSLAYSSNETGPIGFQCHLQSSSEDSGLHHVHEDHVYMEIVDPLTHEPITDGQPGAVLVSALHNEAMPLFRYKLGDVACWVAENCACGSRARQFRLVGRLEKTITLFGQSVSAHAIAAALAPIATLQPEDIQIQQSGSTVGCTLKIILNDAVIAPAETESARKLILAESSWAQLAKHSDVAKIEILVLPRGKFGSVARNSKTPFFILDPTSKD